MKLKDKLIEVEKNTTCLELCGNICKILDGFYINNRIDEDLKQKSGEVKVLWSTANLQKNKLNQLDKNVGLGLR